MDVPYVIKRRLEELGLEQKQLALAAQVTESYISQLLTRKKAPPASYRTDIYEKIEGFLELPSGELATLANFQRMESLRKLQGDEPAPLFEEVRELILRKCDPEKVEQVRAIFEKQPFGELERLVTHNLLEMVKRVAREELEDASRLRRVARLSHMEYEEMRVRVLEFLDTDSFHVSVESSALFLNPLVESWAIDLATFSMEVVLNRRVVSNPVRRLEFTARESGQASAEEPGFQRFLDNPALSGTATEEEIAFLRRLAFKHRRPTPLYYYRELQNLRDPLHFD
jgi:transcriptional regulator with XRE-family HTH domain